MPLPSVHGEHNVAMLILRREMMNSRYLLAIARPAVVALACGCASTPNVAPPEVPQALRPPAGQTVFVEALASGVQIYECAPKVDQPSAFDWNLRAPEAALVDRAGRSIGKHYAGPTWESTDGSTVVGEVKSRDPGPDKSAIPWLLLTAKSTGGSGLFSQTRSIQRVQTSGGIAPTQGCTSDNAKQVARVPYTATYYFYRVVP
jgi:hypothetical protein